MNVSEPVPEAGLIEPTPDAAGLGQGVEGKKAGCRQAQDWKGPGRGQGHSRGSGVDALLSVQGLRAQPCGASRSHTDRQGTQEGRPGLSQCEE